MDITEKDIIQWLHKEREGRGLKSIQIMVSHNALEGDYHDVAVHAEGCCGIADNISSASLALGRKIRQKKTQMEAAHA